jgi:hypothetical protein
MNKYQLIPETTTYVVGLMTSRAGSWNKKLFCSTVFVRAGCKKELDGGALLPGLMLMMALSQHLIGQSMRM